MDCDLGDEFEPQSRQIHCTLLEIISLYFWLEYPVCQLVEI